MIILAGFLGACLYCAVSLHPYLHLANRAFLLKFALFALMLGVAAALLARAIRAVLFKTSGQIALPALLGALLIFVPAYYLNRMPAPNIILLVLDSLRADHLGCYGYERDTSPQLDAFAEREHLFERFYSQSAGTDKSLPAIFASIYPSMFFDPHVDGDNFYVPDKFPLLSQFLKERGYLTWGFSANPHISKSMNYARGYDEFVEFWRQECRPAVLESYFKEKVLASGDEKFFLAGLIIEPHTPYDPPPAYNVFIEDKSLTFATLKELGPQYAFHPRIAKPLLDLYDGEILEADAALGRFFAWLEERGVYERSMIIVTSDHGEAFMEHGAMGHGGLLFEERVHVPLLVRFPSPFRFPLLRPEGPTDFITSQVDLLPTVLGFLGDTPRSDSVQGRNLIPYLYEKEPAPTDSDVFIEELIYKRPIRCLRTAEWKFIHQEKEVNGKRVINEHLYKIDVDPEEAVNLDGVPEYSAVQEAMNREIINRTEKLRRHYATKDHGVDVDTETLEKLKELGYGK